MKVAETVIPGESNGEEDLNRGNENYLPLPAVRVGKGVWVSRYTLSEEERRIVAETGDIYMRMHAVDGDEEVMPHRLFVEKPSIEQLKNRFNK
jgi:hypothetical protein